MPPGMRLWDLLTVSDQTDQSGRLLLEDSAPEQAQEEVRARGIAMETQSCPYSDTPSRLGGDMNVSAYDALREDTAEVLNGLAWLRQNYVAMEPLNAGTVRGLFDVTHMGLTVPAILFHRAQEPVAAHGELPTFVASIFKASRGMYSAAVAMMNKQGPGSATSAEEVVAFADREGHLRRAQTGRVCAGPTRLVQRSIAAALTGNGADPARSTLGDHVQFGVLWDCYAMQERFNQAVSDYRFLLDGLTRSGVDADPSGVFSAAVIVEGKRQSFGAVTEGLLRQANAVQSGLNQRLGRARNARAVRLPDLLNLL